MIVRGAEACSVPNGPPACITAASGSPDPPSAVLVQRIESFQRHVHRSVNRRAGTRQHAGNRVGVVLVQRETHVAAAVGYHNLVAGVVAECGRHLGAEHRVIVAVERGALDNFEPPVARKTKVFEKVPVCAEHPVTPVGIAQ